MLAARPELVGMDMAGNNEHRALHYAVLRNDVPMVRLLMKAGADARKGIWPHRDATSALAIARDREYREVVGAIEEGEDRRRKEMSCPNATISPVQDQVDEAISNGDNMAAIRLLDSDRSLIHACDRNGATPLHVAAEQTNADLMAWLLDRGAGAHKQDLNGVTIKCFETQDAFMMNPLFYRLRKGSVEGGGCLTRERRRRCEETWSR